jgi:NhaP-type Na+/H+ or K+/H+ antiporter
VVTQSSTSALVCVILAWLALCFVADIDEDRDVATFVGGGLTRAVVTLAGAAFVRWLYVRRHGGSVRSLDTLWVAATFAALTAAFRLLADRLPPAFRLVGVATKQLAEAAPCALTAAAVR